MEHWTQVLTNISLVEFVLLAALTTFQWIRHRIRGAGWVALSFAILGGLSLVVKIDPDAGHDLNVAKVLIALLLVMPYCLFRFAASFRTPSRAGARAGMVADRRHRRVHLRSCVPASPRASRHHRTAWPTASRSSCRSVPVRYVVVRLFMAGIGEPPIAAYGCGCSRWRWQGSRCRSSSRHSVCRGPTLDLVTEALTVVMGILFLTALVLPSFVRVLR